MYKYFNEYVGCSYLTQLRQRFILSQSFVSISYQLFQGEDFDKKQPLTPNGTGILFTSFKIKFKI